ncbi:hypothetical protein C8J57DRAFT_1713699 [Mycena rebaudengoi]|nr:hypothetical protein C8J57DRAFT_1713699 [Mycena rebaudengoi]
MPQHQWLSFHLLSTLTPFSRLVGDDGVLPLWLTYGSSPALKAFAWSPLITRALERNFHLLSAAPPPPLSPPFAHRFLLPPHQRQHPRQRLSSLPLSAFAPPPLPHHTATPPHRAARATRPPRRLRRALHQPRGRGRALRLVERIRVPQRVRPRALPVLPEYLDVPDGMSHHAAALVHRWLSAEEILARACTADGWAHVASSLDMQLPRDEQAVTQAIDMSVLVGVETFIGVGFSSLTSNIVP